MIGTGRFSSEAMHSDVNVCRAHTDGVDAKAFGKRPRKGTSGEKAVFEGGLLGGDLQRLQRLVGLQQLPIYRLGYLTPQYPRLPIAISLR
jgi:hypothetical protein